MGSQSACKASLFANENAAIKKRRTASAVRLFFADLDLQTRRYSLEAAPCVAVCSEAGPFAGRIEFALHKAPG
jgi:hypothetical protein